MKRYAIPLDRRQADLLFSPVRSKRQIIDLLIKTVKLFLINEDIKPEHTNGEVVLLVSKMSRFFYFRDKKYFSINCPFFISEDNRQIVFSDRNIVLDHKITSELLSLVPDIDNFNGNNADDFINAIANAESPQEGLGTLLMKLLTFDDGYIRYDDDAINENGLRHPRNHYDVFHSSASTFKIGLRKSITKEELIDLVSIETDCHFLQQV